MNILLINPPNCGRSIPEERYGITSIKQIFRGEPLALETLAGNLFGHEVRIVDLKARPDALGEALRRFTPELIGFSAVTCEANWVRAQARRLQAECGATVVVGGIHASNDPEFFNVAGIDYVVLGLGKQSLRELVEAVETGVDTASIPGVARTAPGQKLRWRPRRYSRADLVEERPPRYDLVAGDRDRYTLAALGASLGFVSSAFGCPYDCSFCCIAPLTDGRYLSSSIATVVRDIQLLAEVPVIRLVDANTFGHPEHARALCRAIVAAGIAKTFLADVRADTVVRHPELLREWRDAGLRSVVIGFEELSDHRLDILNKSGSVAMNLEAIAILHELGINIVGDFIVSPDYGDEDFARLAAYVAEQKIGLPIYTVLTPLPGTALHRQLRSRIVNHDLDYYTLANAVIPTRLDEGEFYRQFAALYRTGHQQVKL
jgi:radical SAM superfamily enzyme YgiQ (UPF0313 family)